MAITLEKLSDTVWALLNDNTIIAEINGSTINVRGTLKMGSDLVSPSSDEIATLNGMTFIAQGVAAGYRIARSAAPVALDGSNPTSVAHGLTTCVAAFVQLVGSAAPGDSTSVLTAVINGVNIDVYAWKHTTGGAAGNPTLVASTGTETFNWFAVGT